jgi:starch phosphorylase
MAAKTRRQDIGLIDQNVGEATSKKWLIHYKGMSTDDLRKGFLNNLEYNIAKDKYTLTKYDQFMSLAYAVRDRLIERWITTQQTYHSLNVKRVYYLSLEFLLGRLLEDNACNLGIRGETAQAIRQLGLHYDDIVDQEPDAGLGNGGLGRLAACYLESMATLNLPAIGYGIRYDFGIFNQKIVKGYQREMPENWLRLGCPWEIERPEYRTTVRFFGRTEHSSKPRRKPAVRWVDTDDVIAMPYDIPIPGFKTNTVNTLRLWSARAAVEFDLEHFNEGDYIGACTEKLNSENISKVLYPNDNSYSNRELRLKQQYFFTSASLQDILRRFRQHNDDFRDFPNKVAIQLNDTHPAIAITELMRLLVDLHGQEWEDAWAIVTRTFAYTNHTLMPEALERWPVHMVGTLLPRIMEIIYDINARFLQQVAYKYPGDSGRIARMSLIEEGPEPQVRMAWLAIVGSYSVNGVAELHTKLLTSGLMKDFYEMWPEKFNNKTNGITPRRWLYHCNPGLSKCITDTIGEGWIKDLYQLKQLEQYADNEEFQNRLREIKTANKRLLAKKLKEWNNIRIEPATLFDVHVKRIHEYKRQLLNVLHIIALYNEIKSGNAGGIVPRTFLFAGKAAPGYAMAKLVVKFINNVADTINHDPDMSGVLQVHFIPNYRVTLAERIIPAADISEQISTAGNEASGTGNMKFALNGALTVGTMDGANIEMCEQMGAENMFIFGLNAEEVGRTKAQGYNPRAFYEKSETLRRVMDLIASGYFNPHEPGIFKPLHDSLINEDRYMILADFESYVNCQKKAAQVYTDQRQWAAMVIRNIANMGKFSSDRSIRQYAEEIWHAEPVEIVLDN